MITFKLLYINVDTIKKILLLDCQDKIFISFCEGDQGNKWNADTAYIKTYTTFQVVIEATIFNRGAYNFKNEGYVAVDDISFSKECKVDFSATLNPLPLTPTPPAGCQSGEFRFVWNFLLILIKFTFLLNLDLTFFKLYESFKLLPNKTWKCFCFKMYNFYKFHKRIVCETSSRFILFVCFFNEKIQNSKRKVTSKFHRKKSRTYFQVLKPSVNHPFEKFNL